MEEDKKSAVQLSIIIVNYNSSNILRDCLRSIEASSVQIGYEVIVVDNHSSDGGLEALNREFPSVSFIELPENVGFAAGNNAGFSRARGATYLLLNPDTEVKPDALQRLYDALHRDPSVGMAGPKIYYADGTLQSAIIPKKVPSVFDFFCELFYLVKIFPASRIFNAYFGARFDYDREQPVGQLCGACLMVKKEVVEKIGPLDEKLFLYFDEADWCKRAADAGYRMLYVPSASITHHEGKSSGGARKSSVDLWFDSQFYLMRKHYGVWTALLLYFVNLAGFTLRILTYPFYLVKDRNLSKIRRNAFALLYHWDLRHLMRIFRP